MLTFSYKSFIGQANYDPESQIYFGRVTNLKDVVTFKGQTPSEAQIEFETSIDDYLEFIG